QHLQIGMALDGSKDGFDSNRGAVIAPHCVYCDRDLTAQNLLLLCVDHFVAAIETICSHVMTAVFLASGRINGQRRCAQRIVSTTHTTLGTGLTVLLNSHGD